MSKQNCWEFMKCGRNPDGHAAAHKGVCPVSVFEELNGIHGGINAGRACWTIDASVCPHVVEGASNSKFAGCWKCDFFQLVKKEENASFRGFIVTYREMQQIQAIRNYAAKLVSERK